MEQRVGFQRKIKRQTNPYPNQLKGRERITKLTKPETKRGHNNRRLGNPENYKDIFKDL